MDSGFFGGVFPPSTNLDDRILTQARWETTFVAVGRFILLSVNTPGYGSVVARFSTTQGQKDRSLIIGKLSSLNIWDSVLTQPEIRRLSIGCGYEVGNLLRWHELFNLTSNLSARIQSATCRHGHGKVLWVGALSLLYVSVEIVKFNLLEFNSSHRIRHNRDSSIWIARNGNRWLLGRKATSKRFSLSFF